MTMNNCHGCKWLDRYKADGNGYCCRVVRSKNYRGQYVENGRLMSSSCVRKPDMERCELYEVGDWKTRYACLGDTLSVGNCIAASMKVSILTDDDIPASAEVVIKARITDGVDYSEWKEMGTFYIDSREENDGLITLQCYDSMLKAGQNYVEDNDTTGRMDWPQSMQA